MAFVAFGALRVNRSTGLFNMSKPTKPFFSQDTVEVINLKSSQQLVATLSGFTLQICMIMALSLRRKGLRSGLVKGQV